MYKEQSGNTRREALYLVCVTLFTVIVILSNLITVKMITLPWLTQYALPAGLLTYPLTFLLGDLVTEIYGGAKAKFMIYLGFGASLIAFGIVYFAIKMPAHPDWIAAYNPHHYANAATHQQAFESIFGLNGIAVLSSLAAYGASQLLDINLFGFFKEITKSRHLWLRNAGSTLVSQLTDTLIVNILLLYCGLKMELSAVVQISMFCYFFKVFFTVCNVPLFYLLVASAKWFLGERIPFWKKRQPRDFEFQSS